MTTTSGNIDATKMVVQAYLNVSQDTTQGIVSEQSINVDCTKNTSACADCINTAVQYDIGNSTSRENICPACYCTLENVNINNIISLDMSAILNIKSSDDFTTQVSNALTQQATQTGTSLFKADSSSSTSKSLEKSSVDMLSTLQKIQNQNGFQGLKAFQVLSLNNPNTSVINVDLDLTIEFISNILQQNKDASQTLDDLQQTVIQLTTEVTQGALATVITWIVTLFIVAVIIAVFIFGIDVVLEVMTLYASS